jgi:hypothetical protein
VVARCSTAARPERRISGLLRAVVEEHGSRAAVTGRQHSEVAAAAEQCMLAEVDFAVAHGGGRGGGRRSDVNLKHDVVLLGRLDNGLGYYRFAYNGSDKIYVGVIAQEVQAVGPDAVFRGSDGYLRVQYNRLGLRFRSYANWSASGALPPTFAATSTLRQQSAKS